jgi:hypothetical protein
VLESNADNYHRDVYTWNIKKDEDLRQLKANGWVAESKNEVDSVYKSMGIRVGLEVKF